MKPDTRWETLLAIDFDPWAARTYAANFPGIEVRCASVADELDRLPAADVLLGGPPCQPFSDGGDNEGESDERDGLPDFCAAVERVRPRQFLMENVTGLLKQRHRRYFGRILERLELAGYVVQHRVFDAANFGVPQFRDRVWVWGIRHDVVRWAKSADVDKGGHRWPEPTHTWPAKECMFGGALATAITVGQALRFDGRVWMDRGAGMCERRGTVETTTNSPCYTIRGAAMAGIKVQEYRWSDEYRAKHPPIRSDEPSQTVVGQWHKGEPSGCLLVSETPDTLIRRLTPDECLRLQSGPDDFAWPNGISKTNRYRVIGNGWACGMAAHMSRALAAADPGSRTVIDLFCGGGLGACGWHGRYWSYTPEMAGEAVSA